MAQRKVYIDHLLIQESSIFVSVCLFQKTVINLVFSTPGDYSEDFEEVSETNHDKVEQAFSSEVHVSILFFWGGGEIGEIPRF